VAAKCASSVAILLFAEHDALDAMGAAGSSVAGDKGCAHLGIALRGLEFSGHSSEKAGQDKLFFNADDGVVGAGHADIGLVSRTSREDALISRGDMGMGAEQRCDAAVKVPAEGYFFAGGFAVEVEQDDLGGDFAEEFVGLAEGVVAAGHEDAALKVHDRVALAVAEFALVEAEAWCADGVVGGAYDAAAARVRVGRDGHVFEDLAFVPDVVAGSDDVGAEVEEFLGDGGGNAEASGSVFAVDDEEIDDVGFDDVGQVFADDVAAGGAEDVADKKDIHWKSLHGGMG
jgi:hypothetical protein